ncbi:hypothetical protein GCM10011507_06480 [Edaphobacter acidisoli]|uniref:Protein kinase domain-containing protein n=1 Tax=Edaphobacter acidisoli TaxID=2040573 RepID=A0A916RIJ4_9BACT|nr:serine/threonine-protein kinase [Edaphobacter acidisoli]GGA57833.1 hypothetical protein GCM10011507_06480 [Edaphobacter acidisoli]
MVPEVGQRFGPYEILGRLGGGGMGHVFRAWDARLHREVAVKLLHDDYKMPAMRERFLLEARAASALNHPNICTIFDIGDQDGNPYLVMELLNGETLKSRIARGPLPVAEMIRYSMEIADALEAADARGVVHRDIKPANIFLVKMPSGRFQAKVLDFGLAKIGLSEGGGWGSRTLDLSLRGGTVGTLSYMSPEQGRGEPLDIRSDLFSLGIVMYEMASGQLPFKGTTSAQMFQQLFNRTPDPVRVWNSAVPRHLEKVIQKLLAKERRDRYQSAKELHEALGTITVRRSLGAWRDKLPQSPWPDRNRAAQGMSAASLPGVTSFERAHVSGDLSQSSESLPNGSPQMPRSPVADARPPRPEGRAPAQDRNGAAREPEWSAQSSAVAISDSSTGKFWAARAMADRAEQERAGIEPGSDSEVAPREDTRSKYASWTLPLVASVSTLPTELQLRLRERRVKRAIEFGVAFVVLLAGIYLLARGGHFRPIVLGPRDALLLTTIQNGTSDKALDDGTIMQGLEMELRQADTLKVYGGEAYHAGLRQIGAATDGTSHVPVDRVAQAVGAKDYLYGEITRFGKSYTISVEVLDTATNDKIVSLDETADGRDQIPAAIGRLAREVRAEVAEGGLARARQTVELTQEATGNVDALHEYALAGAAMQAGQVGDALASYQKAVALDPHFIEAQMKLAWIYRSQGAEVEAANAARLAQGAAGHASSRVKLLAQFCYLINVNSDYRQARQVIRQYVLHNPHDAGGLASLALVSRLEGFLPEALLAAQQSYGENPFKAEAYDEAEHALVGLDRYDEAFQLEEKSSHAGVASSYANALTVAYLGGKQDWVEQQAKIMQAGGASAQLLASPMMAYALYLDNTGQFTAGETAWRAAAASVASLRSAPASLLAQAALDRALTENCGRALALANEVSGMERGPAASFTAAMAAGLCGNKTYADKAIASLQQSFPQNVAVGQYYAPELAAAADIGINDPVSALQLLMGLGGYDQVSLAPYLRGMAHEAVGQAPVAVVDYQAVLNHRGSDYLLSSDLYPMAEIGVARSAWTNHDKAGSAAAYIKFLSLWPHADPKDPLVKEALVRTKTAGK